MAGTLIDLFEKSAEAHRWRNMFLVHQDGYWHGLCYGEISQAVREMGRILDHLSIGFGDRVAIIADNRWEWAVAAFACFRRGAVIVPMYECMEPEEWLFIIRDSGAKMAFVSDRVKDRIRRFGTRQFVNVVGPSFRVWSFDGSTVDLPKLDESAARRPSPEDLAAIVYTSGTTGEPKGVQLTHGNIVSNIEAASSCLTLLAADRSVSFLPWAHMFAFTGELMAMIRAGATIAVCRGQEHLLEDIASVRPTLLFSVPKVFNKVERGVRNQMKSRLFLIRWLFALGLAASLKRKAGRWLGPLGQLALALADRLIFAKVRAKMGGRLRFAVSGGAPLAKETAEFLDAVGIEIYEGYGLTETSPIVAVNCCRHRRFGTVGRPIPGVRVSIDPVEGCEDGEGEICVRGPNVMKGYYHRPDDDAAVFTPDDRFHTGDIGFLDEDGYLHVTGRIKELCKQENGKYVPIGLIEEALKRSSLIANACVFCDGRPYNVALIVPEWEALRNCAAMLSLPPMPDAELLANPRIIAVIADEIRLQTYGLRNYWKIRRFTLIGEDFTKENGLLTQTLKLKRRAVCARWQEEIDKLYARK